MVLDTHAWVWWVAKPERIPLKTRRLLDKRVASGDPLFISSISAWEVAMLVAHGRLELSMDAPTWIRKSEELPFLTFVPVDNAIALRAVGLDGFLHRDPADRIIVATTLGLGARLVTGDKRLHSYRAVRTLWS